MAKSELPALTHQLRAAIIGPFEQFAGTLADMARVGYGEVELTIKVREGRVEIVFFRPQITAKVEDLHKRGDRNVS